MDRGGRSPQLPAKSSMFAVYQNPALSAALTSNSLRPSTFALVSILSVTSLSALAIIFSLYGESEVAANFGLGIVSEDVARLCSKVMTTVASIVLLGTLVALTKAISHWRTRNATDVVVVSSIKGTKEVACLTNRQVVSSIKGTKEVARLTNRQVGLLGLRSKLETASEESPKKPSKSNRSSPSPSNMLVPLHHVYGMSGGKSSTSGGNKMHNFTSPSKSPASPSMYLVPTSSTRSPRPSPFLQTSPGGDKLIASPWSNKRSTFQREIATEEDLKNFLADVDEKISETASKLVTPPPSINAFGVTSPNAISSSVNTSGTTRSTPLRPVTEAAAKLNIQIIISQVGSDTPSIPTAANVSPIERTDDWKPAFAVDEDGVLHQLRATLVQVLDASKLQTSNFQQSPQYAASIPVLQEGVDAIMEHQRLHALMKGEWAKGLLPQSSVRADYTVQRIQKLSEGTCLKNYEYLGNGVVYNKENKKWSLELPSDSHSLLYLFCAFLEYPKWMLHIDPTTYAGEQASKNPLFLGVLPPKERFPEKYIAIISGVPSVLHPGACILAVGKQSPPVFALYWDKKPQFSFQGRTALWDSILLLCYKIKISYGGIVRGMHLGSSALGILPVLEQETV